MRRTQRQSSLQTLVIGLIAISELIDDPQEGELAVEWTPRLFAMPAGYLSRRVLINLVDIVDAEQLCGMVAYITNLQRKIAGQCLLDVEIPVGNIRSAKIAIHSEGINKVLRCNQRWQR